MSESTASERSQPTPDSATSNMSKEYPPTTDMRILAEKEGYRPEGFRGSPNLTFEIGREPDPLKAPEILSTPDLIDVRAASENSTGQINPSDRFNSTLDTLLKQGVSKHSRENHGRSGRNGEVPPYLQGKMPHYSTAPYGDRPDPFATGVGDLPPGPSRGQVSERSSTPALDPREGAFRFGLPPLDSESKDPSPSEEESPEARSIIERASRLAGLPFVDAWMKRAKNYVDKLSDGTLRAAQQKSQEIITKSQKVDPRLGVAIVGLAALYAMLLGRGGPANGTSSAAESFPGNQYSPIEYTYDNPSLNEVPAYRPLETSAPPVNETIAVEDPLPSMPNGEKIQFPDNVKDRSLDGLIKKKIVERDPEFQRWLQETGTNSADVATGDPQFQAALYRVTQEMGGANLEKVVNELVKTQKEEIKARNRGIILDPADNNRIARSGFEMRAIDDKLIQETQDKVKADKLVKAKDAAEYIKGLVNLSSDPVVEKLLGDLDKNPEKFELTQTMGKDGDPYFVDIYDIKGQNGEPIMTYQIERMSDGRISKAMTYRKDSSGKFITVKMGNEPGILEADQQRLFTEAFPGVDVSNFKSSMGRYENGEFGRSFYGDWEKDGKRYSGGIDVVGRISVRQYP